MISLSYRNKISIKSVNLNDLYNKNINPYVWTIYTSGNGLPFKPVDIKNYFIEYKIDNHFLVIK